MLLRPCGIEYVLDLQNVSKGRQDAMDVGDFGSGTFDFSGVAVCIRHERGLRVAGHFSFVGVGVR